MVKEKYSVAQKEQMIQLRKEGFLLREIADKVGVDNLTTIRNICKEAGLPPKTHHSAPTHYDVGQRYNNFVIIKKYSNKITKTGRIARCWECLCDCGKLFIITSKQIHRGQKSCGCLSVSGRFHKFPTKLAIGNLRFNHYKQSAVSRNLSWELTKEEFSELLYSNCHYCHSEPLTLVKSRDHEIMVNGVDRVDSNIGYTTNNCVACCKFCNRAKSDATLEEFTAWLKRVKSS